MARRKREPSGPGWLATLVGFAVLAGLGFTFGLVAGIVVEEPELVVDHLAGEGEEVAWPDPLEAPDGGEPRAAAPDPGLPSVAERPPAASPPRRPEAPKESREPRPTGTGSGFAVQVGAFADSGSAEALAAALTRKGFTVYLAPAPAQGDQRWRVRVGPVGSRDEAEVMARRLKTEEKLPTWVLSEGGR
ncbi:MAG: SPOR domain-containing protein [Proteobacteria bacterium]|nr:SPOR domain-containing protein [Pseudomonadota bacterium]